jgi:hypothetical protein
MIKSTRHPVCLNLNYAAFPMSEFRDALLRISCRLFTLTSIVAFQLPLPSRLVLIFDNSLLSGRPPVCPARTSFTVSFLQDSACPCYPSFRVISSVSSSFASVSGSFSKLPNRTGSCCCPS